jgi:predicted DNA binding CopG/RHH family protein
VKKHYDFSNARKNPFERRLKRRITLRLDQDTIAYFQSLSAEHEIPYQALISLYLRDCAASGRRLKLDWKPRTGRGAA